MNCYFTYSDGQEIRWQDNINHIFMWSHEGVKFPFPRDNYNRGESINRKPFDIVTYDFFCGDIDYAVRSTSNNVVMVMTEPVDCLRIEKQDAIALAKHFKLKAEDLL